MSIYCFQFFISFICFAPQDIKTDKRGHILVDEYQNTNVPGVYALGDVCGKQLLTPGLFSLLQ